MTLLETKKITQPSLEPYNEDGKNDIHHDLGPNYKGGNIVQRKNNNKTNHIIRENHNNTTTEMTWLKGFCGYSPNICRYVHDLRDMSRK
jgi:hypothetical protein